MRMIVGLGRAASCDWGDDAGRVPRWTARISTGAERKRRRGDSRAHHRRTRTESRATRRASCGTRSAGGSAGMSALGEALPLALAAAFYPPALLVLLLLV